MKPLISPAGTAAIPNSAGLSAARRRLFETALGLFSQYGYNGVSVRDIVAVLDLQPTAIYAHVSSKEELLFELVRIGHEELRDRVREAVLEAGSDPGDQLRAIVAANARTHLTFPELARVSQNEQGQLSPEHVAVINVLRGDLGSLLRDVIKRGVAKGVFDPPDLEITYVALTTMGVRVLDWWATDLGVDIEQVATTHAELAMRMMTPSAKT